MTKIYELEKYRKTVLYRATSRCDHCDNPYMAEFTAEALSIKCPVCGHETNSPLIQAMCGIMEYDDDPYY